MCNMSHAWYTCPVLFCFVLFGWYRKFLIDLCDRFAQVHDDVIKWKHFPRNWSFLRGIRRSPVTSPHKGQWCGALMSSLICAWINGWVNTRVDGDHRVIAIVTPSITFLFCVSRWWRQTLNTCLYVTVISQSEARVSTEHKIIMNIDTMWSKISRDCTQRVRSKESFIFNNNKRLQYILSITQT